MASGSGKKGRRNRSPKGKGTKQAGATPAALKRQSPSWVKWFALGMLLLVHVFLLVGVFNPAPHSGGDNAGYLTLAYSLLDRGEYLDLYDPAEPPHTKYPPGFPLVLAAAMLLGARTWAQFKVISGLAIFATVGLSVAWAWRRRGWRFGIGVGAVLACANAFLYASQWILSDPMFLVLTMAALVAFDAASPAHEGEADRPTIDGKPDADAPDTRVERRATLWLALGMAATVAAFFTRSAGLPLVVAAGAWFLLRRRLGALAVFGVVFGVPAVLWRLRDRVLGGPGYTGEFWMINPYQPDLGTAGPLDLVGRVTTNAVGYFTAHIPTGFVGARGGLVAVLGIVMVTLATLGWARRIRRPGVAELFAPMYLGLVLLWPEVWSGDRFALPLFPLLVFYAGEALLWAGRTLPAVGRSALVGAGLAVLLVPSAAAWQQSARESENCRARMLAGPFACYGAGLQEFVDAANWTQDNLPEGSVVLSRKPRIFFVVSGTPSQVFPFSSEADELIEAAEEVGAEYVVLDQVDNLAAFYLVPILQRHTNLFCTVQSFGGGAAGRSTELLGLQPTVAAAPPLTADGRITLRRCPASMIEASGFQSSDASSSNVVPLLRGLDS